MLLILKSKEVNIDLISSLGDLIYNLVCNYSCLNQHSIQNEVFFDQNFEGY